MEARFSDAENILHKECFYDGVFQVGLVTDKIVEDVKEYLDGVAQLTDGQRR